MLKQISMVNRMSAASQLLKALECLHKAEIVHHSELTPTCFPIISVPAKYSTDLNEDSVMWGVAPLDNLNTSTKYKHIGWPKKIDLPRNSWRQGELVAPLKIPLSLITDAIYLCNFGMATKAGTEVRDKLPSPVYDRYYAPERFHNMNPSSASDMWSYMCLFSELYLGWVPWTSYSEVSMISKMVRTLGPLPKQWRGWGTCGNWWYDQRRKPDPEQSLESIIKEGRPEVGEVERNHIVSIMKKGFCYSPDLRPSATQLRQDPSFQAVMVIYCC
jgi:serine/threonine protein kinase